jgi:DNA-binding XRE family transcriptional regulator
MSDRTEDAVRALLQYEQADFDGIIVKASRQAIHEVVDALATRDAEIERLKGAGSWMADTLNAIARDKQTDPPSKFIAEHAAAKWSDATRIAGELESWKGLRDMIGYKQDARVLTTVAEKALAELSERQSREMFATRVRVCIAAAGLTQSGTARKIGTTRMAVSKWANGSAFPSSSHAVALCRITGASMDWLFDTEPFQMRSDWDDPFKRQFLKGR